MCERAKKRGERRSKRLQRDKRRKERSEENLPQVSILPKIGQDSGGCFDLPVSFDFKARVDPQGNDLWGAEDGWEEDLKLRLSKQFADAKWSQLFSQHICAERTIARLPPKATKHLKRLGYSAGKILRFQLSSKERLWGFERSGNFEIVWYDPKHKVYPSKKKNT